MTRLTEHAKPSRPTLALQGRWLLPLVLAGCASDPGGGGAVSAVGATVASAASAVAREVRQQTPTPTTSQSTTGGGLAQTPVTPTPGGPAGFGDPLFSRSPLQLQTLLNRRDVNGADLAIELIAMRTLMRDRRSSVAVRSLLGSPPISGVAAFDPKAEALKVALRVAEDQMRPYIASIGFGALELHLKTLTDDTRLISAERIELPSPRGMTAAQMQRVVNMAAILVATRATAKILQKAKQDFANVESDYTALIERREKVAQVLYGVLLRTGGPAPELVGVYTDADLRYLRDNVQRMSVKDFANDLGAQNLALRYLRKSDPAAWTEYRARSDGLQASTRGYIRATAGAAAFAALLANFSNETLGAVLDNKAADIFNAVPFAWEFTKEVPPVLKTAWDVGAAGIIELPMKSTRRFRVIEGANSQDLARSSDVFALLKQRNAEPVFNEALFRTGADGLLYKVYRCDRSEAGRMLDVAVPIAARERFAAAHLPVNEPARFAFQNAFNAPADNVRERELADELLRQDHRERTSTLAFGELQRSATQGAARWNNDQLVRLILANREGVAAHATLQLGDVVVRPVPSMQSVYAYESLIDQCARQFGGGPAAAAPPAAPAKPGAAKPAPAKPPAAPAKPPAKT